ncbi:hypothetical protein HDU98_004669 [Podochytrium sp. JEL0797]|nr:hypothetical protein HDU98_004669 [Podochytrium sp. JEL0797]
MKMLKTDGAKMVAAGKKAQKAREKEAKGLRKKRKAAVVFEDEEDEEYGSFDGDESENNRGLM